MSSTSSAISALFGGAVVVILLPVLLLGVLLIVIVANRSEPDPTGRRPFVVYYLAVSFISVFAVLFSTYAALASLLSLAGNPAANGDSVARVVVLALIVALFTGLLLATHLRRGLDLARLGADATDPSVRVLCSYVGAVSFLVVLIFVVSMVGAVDSLVRASDRNVFNPGGSTSSALRTVADFAYLALASAAIFYGHFRLTPRHLGPFGMRRPGTPASPPRPPEPSIPPIAG